MWKPPWWWWLQIRDIVPIVVCVLVLIGFLYAAAFLMAHIITAGMADFRHAWNG